MARESTCPYCGRNVGLINDKPTPGSLPRGPRLIRHAAVDPTPSQRGARPRCELGSGLPVDPADVRDVPHAPSRRTRSATVTA